MQNYKFYFILLFLNIYQLKTIYCEQLSQPFCNSNENNVPSPFEKLPNQTIESPFDILTVPVQPLTLTEVNISQFVLPPPISIVVEKKNSYQLPDPVNSPVYFESTQFVGFLPTGRVLPKGKIEANYIGLYGLGGINYGATDYFTIGAGFSGISLEFNLKLGIIRKENINLSAYVFSFIPFVPLEEDYESLSEAIFGFSSFAGGLILSIFGEHGNINFGYLSGITAKNIGDGAFAMFPYVSAELKFTKYLSGLISFVDVWTFNGNYDQSHYFSSLIGIKYIMRRVSFDIGLWIPGFSQWYDRTSWAIIPVLNINHTIN